MLSSLPRKSGRCSSPNAPPDSQSLLTGCRIKLLPSLLGSLFKRLQHFCHFGQSFQTCLSHLSLLPSSRTNSISLPTFGVFVLYKKQGASSRKKVKVGERKCGGMTLTLLVFGVACEKKNQWHEAGEGGQQGRNRKFLSMVAGSIAAGGERVGSGRSPSDCICPKEEICAAPNPQLGVLVVPVRGLVGVCHTPDCLACVPGSSWSMGRNNVCLDCPGMELLHGQIVHPRLETGQPSLLPHFCPAPSRQDGQ